MAPFHAFASLDSMDGPVVSAAKKALETGDVNYALIWVQKDDEAEVKKVFDKALSVRKLGSDAMDVADMYLFETLVRLNSASEGTPYTGIKPAGFDSGTMASAVDKAINSSKADNLKGLLGDAMKTNLEDAFGDLLSRKDYSKDDVSAGRKYAESYVTFLNYIERIYEATKKPSSNDRVLEE